MSKKTETLQTDASSRLRALLDQEIDLDRRLVELRAQHFVVDLSAPGASRRASELRGQIKALEESACALVPQISAARDDLQAEVSHERDSQLLALRGEEPVRRKPIVALVRELKAALEVWRAFCLREAALGGQPFYVVPGQLEAGIEIALAYWRQAVPEELGLPPKLSRHEELRADAVLQCENAIEIWRAADERSRTAGNSNLRSANARRAAEFLRGVERTQARCRDLGIAVPSGGLGLLQALENLARQAVDGLKREPASVGGAEGEIPEALAAADRAETLRR